MGQRDPQIVELLKRVLQPLVHADGGTVYVVEAASDRVSLHLTGRFSGCPGNALVSRRLIAPLIASVAPRAQVSVTAGRLLPEGAEPL